MDLFYVFANTNNGNGEALINWADPGTFNGTEANAPDWTANRGYRGAPGDIETGFNPLTHGTNFQDSATMMVYNLLNVTGSYYDMGANGSPQFSMGVDYGGTLYARLNSTNLISVANADGSGIWYGVARSDSMVVYHNYEVFASHTGGTTGVGDDDIHVLSRAGGSQSDNEIAVSFLMDGITFDEMIKITDFVETYMDNIGTGIIP
jgi:hypothetical protein